MIRRLLALVVLLPALARASYNTTVAADTPQHWYHLDESSGTTATDVGLANGGCSFTGVNGTYTGGFTLGATGIAGSPGDAAVTLNGSTGYINTGGNTQFDMTLTNNQGFSAEAWLKATSVKDQILVANGTNAAFEYYLWALSSGTFQIEIFQSGGSCGGADSGFNAGAGSYGTGAFHQVVFTTLGNGTTLTHAILYVDGASVATVSSFTGTPCTTLNAFKMGQSGNSTQFINGVLDEVSTYKTCSGSGTGELSAARVLAHFNAGNSAPATTWPYTVKRPELPRFRDDGYWSKFVEYGYHTGLFTRQARMPQYIAPYPTFDVVPPGNVR